MHNKDSRKNSWTKMLEHVKTNPVLKPTPQQIAWNVKRRTKKENSK